MKLLWMDGRTHVRMDGHLRPALLGWLCRRVDLKTADTFLTTSFKTHIVVAVIMCIYKQCVINRCIATWTAPDDVKHSLMFATVKFVSREAMVSAFECMQIYHIISYKASSSVAGCAVTLISLEVVYKIICVQYRCVSSNPGCRRIVGSSSREELTT